MQCATCNHENSPEAKLCVSCASPLNSDAGDVYTHFLPKNTRLQNGAYAVAEVLGQGGFGITYKGGDMSLRRYVAIKEFFPQGSIRHNSTIRPDRTLSPADYNGIKAKFIDEAHRLARFSFPASCGFLACSRKTTPRTQKRADRQVGALLFAPYFK